MISILILKIQPSQDLVNNYIVPALEIVGKKYETGKIFLPQLLKSASAAQSAFAAIKECLKGKGMKKLVWMECQKEVR